MSDECLQAKLAKKKREKKQVIMSVWGNPWDEVGQEEEGEI